MSESKAKRELLAEEARSLGATVEMIDGCQLGFGQNLVTVVLYRQTTVEEGLGKCETIRCVMKGGNMKSSQIVRSTWDRG